MQPVFLLKSEKVLQVF